MNLDLDTLFKVTLYVEAMLGLLLLFAWVQNTATRAVCWWGFAHLLRAFSVALFGMYGLAPDLISIDIANALLFTSFALTWTGARVFDARAVEPVYLVAGAAIWLLVCRLPLLRDSIEVRFADRLRDNHRLLLDERVRVLARTQRAFGFALAGDLHVIRTRRAVPAAHAADFAPAAQHDGEQQPVR